MMVAGTSRAPCMGFISWEHLGFQVQLWLMALMQEACLRPLFLPESFALKPLEFPQTLLKPFPDAGEFTPSRQEET